MRKSFRVVMIALLVLMLAACKASADELVAEETEPSAAETLSGGSLADLQSYRFMLEMTTTQDVGGQLIEEKETIIQEAVRAPEEFLHIQRVAQNDETGIIPVRSDRYRQGLLAYEPEQLPDGDVCHIYDLEQSPLSEDGAIDPETFFDGLDREGPQDRGKVVNNVVADRFSISGMNLPLDVVEEEEVQLWVAQDGGYIVRFTVEAKGQMQVEDGAVPASLRWEYNLKDVNTEFEIALSPECQRQKEFLDSLPMPETAENVEIMDNGVAFSSPDSSDEMADFIRKGMQGSKWVSLMDHDDEETGMYLFMYQQEEYYLDVMIGRPEEGGSFVTYLQREE